MATIITNGRTGSFAAQAKADPWIALRELATETGWELKPEGACLDERCVPIPKGRESEFIADGCFNMGALARHLGQPIAHDADSQAWVIGESAEARTGALQSLEAPDFTLPDLDGRMHSLSDYRGKKVFLVSWASW